MFRARQRERCPLNWDGGGTAGRPGAGTPQVQRAFRAGQLQAQPSDLAKAFATLALGPGDVDLIVCSDAEEILGIGDWGVGGIQIAVGKLAVYTAAAGIDPRRVAAVSLDVGTDNQALLDDPLYLGNRHSRVRGAAYDAFIEEYLKRRGPRCCRRRRTCASPRRSPRRPRPRPRSARAWLPAYPAEV